MLLKVNFDLPVDIIKGLTEGAYKMFGGVIRDQKGQIVALLKEASPTVEREAAKALAKAAYKNKYLLLGTVVIGTVALAGVGIYLHNKKTKSQKDNTDNGVVDVAKEDASKIIEFKKFAEKGKTYNNKKAFI